MAVPVNVPPELSVKPEPAREPARTLNVLVLQPVAVKVTFTVCLALNGPIEVGVIWQLPLMVMVRFCATPDTPFPSIGVTENGKLLASVGVPEILHVFELSVNPFGSAPEVRLQETTPVPPVSDSVFVYACPIAPVGMDNVVMLGAALTITWYVAGTVFVPSVAVMVKLNVPAAVRVPPI